jgi:hypothetical protein
VRILTVLTTSVMMARLASFATLRRTSRIRVNENTPWSLFMPAVGAILLCQASCNLVSKTIATGGEERLTEVAPPPTKIGPHVIIFALDGAVPSKLMDAVDSGRAPHIAAILGKDKGSGLFAHAYAAPHALSVLPSSTIADWASVFMARHRPTTA